MTILDKIIAYKHKEVAARKKAFPIATLEHSTLFRRETTSLAEAIKNSSTGIIAEHKRRSPSKSVINEHVFIDEVAKGYEDAGVCGISVLTDTNFFGGSLDDFLVARSVVKLPLLRKEFIIDPYQIYEAKAYGADAILLIAAVLDPHQLNTFSTLAKNLQLDVLLEVHNVEELEKSILPTVDMIGVNNRNLKTFEVSLERSKELSTLIPSNFVKISESGISAPEAIHALRQHGYQGFLMGENFMKHANPEQSAGEFIKSLQ
ncbi:indole-3-glycerol phosphate synthase [Ulvibacter sp. MAR_2010_11]|uniref:indole-3-glycerol phosphate synthase TrpC n=1 Tax=Ulvibacter sp. MAR_2010_11 TaxID=1250229 RepID=UPI000C2CAE15|nr:indole-3-glycerol phosphate synthase TrpC [Ulvibacter sp. MAR_2010_11]PKA83576.1 indole-3-glycerol phosphate synthase [Ulvibacter sp. MAR_2010_11]